MYDIITEEDDEEDTLRCHSVDVGFVWTIIVDFSGFGAIITASAACFFGFFLGINVNVWYSYVRRRYAGPSGADDGDVGRYRSDG